MNLLIGSAQGSRSPMLLDPGLGIAKARGRGGPGLGRAQREDAVAAALRSLQAEHGGRVFASGLDWSRAFASRLGLCYSCPFFGSYIFLLFPPFWHYYYSCHDDRLGRQSEVQKP